MIVLNRDKEIVVVQTWAEIQGRPGFNADLDPARHELKVIIGRYAFADHVPCGLSNCHTMHGRGYIVVTKDGHETNIGKDCGKTYFGVDFETLSAAFERDLEEKTNRERIFTFLGRIEEVDARVKHLRSQERGADWVYKTSRPLIEGSKEVPGAVMKRVAHMVKNRNPVLTVEYEADEDEIKRREAQSGRSIERPLVLSRPIGRLAGLEALFPENNLLQLLVIDVGEALKELEAADIDALDFKSLRRWSRWIGEVDVKLEQAAAAISKGRELLTSVNLEPLVDAADLSSEGVVRFRDYLGQLPAK